jgi:predicted DNA-binding transcriptional regulator YafY
MSYIGRTIDAMEKPLQRVLTALELLQSHASLSGAQLAELIGVDRRTVRRYIVELETFGVPIRSTRGRDGHYALMPGYKLPPMMFSNDETLALSVGLRVARDLGLSDMTPAVASAQAKLDRVMPASLRRKIGDLNAVVALDLAPPQAQSGSEFFAAVTQCASAGQTLRMHYCAPDGGVTEREVDPYGIGYLNGAWYVVGHCHLRRGLRSFRLDRVQAVQACPKTFGVPQAFNVLEYLRESIAAVQRTHAVVVRFADAEMAVVRRQVPSSICKLTQERGHIRLDAQADDLDWVARELARLNLQFEIVKPKALTHALRAHVQHILQRHA